MPIYKLGDDIPIISASAYVAPEAIIIGKVILGENASVWPGVVIRGDNDSITIGNGSNVQDGTIMHTDPGFPLTVGDNVTIGHQAMLHGCTIADGCLVDIQALVMNAAVIGKDCLVGAGSLVPEGKSYRRTQTHPRRPGQSHPRTERQRYRENAPCRSGIRGAERDLQVEVDENRLSRIGGVADEPAA